MQRSFIAFAGAVAFAALRLQSPASADAPATPSASASPVPATYVRFVEADVLPGERTANAYTPNLTGTVTNRLRGTLEFKFYGSNFVEVEYRRWNLVHPAGNVTQILTRTPQYVPAARYVDQDVFINGSIIGRQHTYLATSTWFHSTSDGDPNVHSDIGFGIERLPDPSKPASIFFSYYYYPEVTGKIGVPPGAPAQNLRYTAETYSIGGSLAVPRTPVFLTAGLVGDRYFPKQNAASGASHSSAELGLALHI